MSDGVLLGALGLAAACGVFLAVAPLSQANAMRGFWAVQALLDIFMVAGCRRVTTLSGSGVPGTRFWRWLGRAGLLFLAADVAETWTAITDPRTSVVGGGNLHAVLVASGIVTMIGVTLTHPSELTGPQRRRMWLDAATVMAAAVAAIWYFTGGDFRAQSVAVSVVAIVSVFGLVKVALSARPPFTRATTLVGIAGVAATGIADAVPADQRTAHQGIMLFLQLLPSITVAVTPRVQEVSLRREAARAARPRRAYSLLPYAAVAVSQGMAAITVFASSDPSAAGKVWGVVAGNVIVTALVVGRQLDAFRENVTLLGQLDSSLLRLSRAEKRYRSLVQYSSDITLIISPDGIVTYASPALEVVLGVDPESAVGQPPPIFQMQDQTTDTAGWPSITAPESHANTRQMRARHADGSERWLEVTFTNLTADPSVAGIVCNARDITEAHQLHDTLRHQASHDALTQLANRAAFDEQIAKASRAEDPVAVLMIDLNGFKPINDTHGHHVGDELLVRAAARIRSCVRPGDMVARLGGDEFAVLLEGTTQDQAVAAAGRITAALQAPIPTTGGTVSVSASVGVAVGLAPQLERLMRDADAAMYQVKRGTPDGGYLCAWTVPQRRAGLKASS